MNNSRRKALQKIADQIESMDESLALICDEEQEAFNNMPEGIQESEKGERVQECADEIDEVRSELEELRDRLINVISN